MARTRASKGKSRSGCITCKKRKVKCDEARPACSGCVKRSHECLYKINEGPKWRQSVRTFTTGEQSKIALSRANSTKSSSDDSDLESKSSPTISVRSNSVTAMPNYHLSLIPSQDRELFGIEDGLLLTHFESTSSLGLIGDQKLWVTDILQLAFQNSFLLRGMLTIAARHLQQTYREQAITLPYDFKQLQETHLQKTLFAFHSAMREAPLGKHEALLATSFLLSFYACSIQDFKPSATVPSEDTSFIFLLGTRSLVMDNMDRAHNGVLGHLTKPPKWLALFLPRITPIFGPGGRLINLINRLPPTSPLLDNKEVYVERIESLTVYFSTTSAHAPDHNSVENLSLCFLRWQAVCPLEFVSLVKAYDPIALIILAHFYAAAGFVQMKVDNLWWWWQDKPKYMVETIAEYLLPAWAEWMEWPIEMIGKFGRNFEYKEDI